ncbi:hypothetical protein Pfo_018213, partial [Paulownia fortunei]
MRTPLPLRYGDELVHLWSELDGESGVPSGLGGSGHGLEEDSLDGEAVMIRQLILSALMTAMLLSRQLMQMLPPLLFLS